MVASAALNLWANWPTSFLLSSATPIALPLFRFGLEEAAEAALTSAVS